MDLRELYNDVNIPIIIVNDNTEKEVVYINNEAVKKLGLYGKTKDLTIFDALIMHNADYLKIFSEVNKNRYINNFDCSLYLNGNETLFVSLSINKISIEDKDYIKFTITSTIDETIEENYLKPLQKCTNIANKALTAEEAINNLLTFVGNHINCSRSYIIESISDTMVSNTYEWCAQDIKPMKHLLQNLDKDKSGYNEIIARQVVLVNDVRTLDSQFKEKMEMQGIKSIVIVPIITQKGTQGYIGFDDCVLARVWSASEIDFLKNLSDLVGSFLIRRDSEERLKYSLNVLDTIINNSDNFILVVDILSNKVIYTNKAFQKFINIPVLDLIGKDYNLFDTIYSLKSNEDIKELDRDVRIKTGNSEWEIYLKDSDMWYSLKETYVKWIDGSNVRIETVSDITKQKRYESELFKVATTDMMTQTINRDTCEKVLNALLSKRNEQINSIVFIDFDGLKFVNDNYGHQEGDFLIMKTINIIKSCIRKSDTISRWGGDEFILILRANQSASNVVMDNINKEITKFNSDKLKPYSLSFSHGIVEINHNTNETIESLMNKLDKKMYENKLIKRG